MVGEVEEEVEEEVVGEVVGEVVVAGMGLDPGSPLARSSGQGQGFPPRSVSSGGQGGGFPAAEPVSAAATSTSMRAQSAHLRTFIPLPP